MVRTRKPPHPANYRACYVVKKSGPVPGGKRTSSATLSLPGFKADRRPGLALEKPQSR